MFRLFVLSVLCTACTTPYSPPAFSPETASFPGIAKILNTTGDVEVVSIHGMCTHTLKHWALPANEALAGALGASSIASEAESFDRLKLYRWTLSVNDKTVTHYAVVWSEFSRDFKLRLCPDNGKEPKNYRGVCEEFDQYDYKRADLNASFKANLLNDCLADVTYYMGDGGEAVRDAVRDALRFIEARRGRGPVPPLFLITESLGSKIIADALDVAPRSASSDAAPTALERFLAPGEIIFMAANQLPLLAAGDDTLDASYRLLDLTHSANATLAKRDGVACKAMLVAFTDPNDLLSYTLRDESRGTAQSNVVDVIVSNDSTVLGLFENPYPAHTGYLENEDVWELIVYGR